MQAHIESLAQFQVNDALCRGLLTPGSPVVNAFAILGRLERELVQVACIVEIPMDSPDFNTYVTLRLSQYKGMSSTWSSTSTFRGFPRLKPYRVALRGVRKKELS